MKSYTETIFELNMQIYNMAASSEKFSFLFFKAWVESTCIINAPQRLSEEKMWLEQPIKCCKIAGVFVVHICRDVCFPQYYKLDNEVVLFFESNFHVKRKVHWAYVKFTLSCTCIASSRHCSSFKYFIISNGSVNGQRRHCRHSLPVFDRRHGFAWRYRYDLRTNVKTRKEN